MSSQIADQQADQQAEIAGNALTPQGFVQGVLHVQAGRIAAVEGRALSEEQARDNGQPLLLPGFIDLHVHGGAGHDVMQGGAAAAAIARAHAEHGTTALLATTMTAPTDEIEAALRDLRPTLDMRPSGAARVLGVHLEGPYISGQRLGAQPDFACTATLAQVLALHAIAPLVLITLAPELPEHIELIVQLRAHGFVVQLGHSNASYEVALAALQAGASGFTHLFNAMSGLHHRAPGLVGAALAHAERAEIIPDLLHVHPGAMRAALRAIPGLYCVTDSTAAAGMPDGPYRLGRHEVNKCLGAVRLADGTLAGSALTMDQALRNLVSLGLSVTEASRRTATLAAQHIAQGDRGELRPGAWADVVVLNDALQVQRVVVEGEVLG